MAVLFVLYLAALTAFPPFSTDIYLASMPMIQQSFLTTDAMVQLTLSLFFVGFSLGQLYWGPLSDRLGRRPVLWIGVSVYVVASFFCSMAQSIGFLILMRFIQSIGASAGTVISLAIVRDRYQDHQMARILSVMITVMMMAPLVAPIIGSYLLVTYDWRANFYFLMCFGLLILAGLLFMGETHPLERREPLHFSTILSAYVGQLRCIPFMWATLVNTTVFCMMFSFIASSSFIYQRIYGVSPGHFGYFFAFNALGLMLGSMTINLYGRRWASPHRLTFYGAWLSFVSSIVMWVALQLSASVMCVMVPMFVATYGVGLAMPSSTAIALMHVKAYSGLASALLGCLRFLSAAGVSALMGFVVSRSAEPLSVVMMVLGVLSVLSVWRLCRHQHQA